jgi:type I restriction enzyme, S subunit
LFLSTFDDPVENPRGWTMASLGELIAEGPQNGLYRPAADYGEGTRILRIDSFDGGVIHDIGGLRRLRIDEAAIQQYALRPGDIVINRVNSPPQLGKSVLVPQLTEAVVVESNMMRLRLDASRLLPEVLIVMLQIEPVRRALVRNAKHAVNQSSINQSDVKALRLPEPPLTMQVTFASRLADLRAIIARQERALAAARDLELSLLARLLG